MYAVEIYVVSQAKAQLPLLIEDAARHEKKDVPRQQQTVLIFM